jgi:hypothetical protein
MSKNKLPCPRFEFLWEKDGNNSWRNRTCTYYLVIPLSEFDIRREDCDGNKVREELKIEVGKTTVEGGSGRAPIYEDGTVETPFRDGAHARWDKKSLGVNFPIIAVCGDIYNEVTA